MKNKKQNIKMKLVKMDDIKFNDDLFIPIKSKTIVDSLLSNEGGWIVNAEKKHFCHDGKDGSCFDKYCEDQKNIAEDASYEGS